MFTAPCIAELPFSFLTESQPKVLAMQLASDSILIVDDNAEVRAFMRNGLEELGYCCQEAEDGLVALRQIRKHHYNVVLTDLNMPFLDGLGLAQHLMEDSSLGNPMVIMMTSSESQMVARLASAFGVQKTLVKPCRPSDVDKIIRPVQIKFPWAA